MHVVVTVEGRDDDKSGIGVALKFFELANGIINAELGGVFRGRNDLKVVETNYRSIGFVGAERFKQSDKVVDRLVLKFQNAEVEFGRGEFGTSSGKLNRPSPTADIGGSQIGGRNTVEKFTGERFGEEFKLTHLVGTENAGLVASRKLFEQLPAEGSFSRRRSCADDVKSRIEKLKLVEIIEAGEPIRVVLHLFNFGIKMVGEEVSEGKFFGRNDGAVDLVESQLSFGDDVGRRKLSQISVLANDFGSDDESAQVGFLFDDVSVIFGASGGVGGVDEREQVQVVDFVVVTVFL